MDVAGFTDVDAKDENSMLTFLDSNALAHETIYNALLTSSQITIEHYPLWSSQMPDTDWLFIHDREHKAIADALNLPLPPDLSQVDFNDAGQAEDWFNNHALTHDLIDQTLGL